MNDDAGTSMIRLFVWPDGSWLPCDEYEDYTDAWRGDDYVETSVPAGLCDAEIDRFARSQVSL